MERYPCSWIERMRNVKTVILPNAIYRFNKIPIKMPMIFFTKELIHWKRPWCWERLRAGRQGVDRGWDIWMASLTQWTWVWANSRRWWKTKKSGMLQSMGSQSIGCDWAIYIFYFSDLKWIYIFSKLMKFKNVYVRENIFIYF